MKQAERYADLALHHRNMGDTSEAIRACLRAIELAPNVASSYINLALLYRDVDDLDMSNKMLMRAMAIEPENPSAHLALGENLLTRGEFKAGWREYEWRNKLAQASVAFNSAQWNGMKLPDGGKLVVFADQGYGDNIQFVRFLPALKPFANEIIFCCEADLACAFGPVLLLNIQVVTEWERIPAHAAHVRLSSVPGLLNIDHAALFPAVPYIFSNPYSAGMWDNKLTETLPDKPWRVGLVWSGRRTHPNDRQRSIPLILLEPLFSVGGVQLIALQNDMTDSEFVDACNVDEPGREHFLLAHNKLGNFSETAALIECLDLVISVDTAVAHLAGAMGKPTWVMLPTPCDWRWQRGRVDTPWYPAMRIFRQPSLGDWEMVIAQVAHELREHFI